MSNWQRGNDAKTARSDLWVIDLPAEIRGNNARLRTTAANLLELTHVRSVVIDSSHGQAVVRLHRNAAPGVDLGAIPEFADDERTLRGDAIETVTAATCFSWTDPRDQSLCFIRLPRRVHGWRRGLLFLAAAAALVLGLLGVILPGLPTTPFVLVASYCLLRCSPQLHARLLESRLLGDVLRDWHLHRGIRRRVRYKATAVIVLVLGASLVFTSLPIVAKLMILAIAACGIIYVWRLPEVFERMSSNRR